MDSDLIMRANSNIRNTEVTDPSTRELQSRRK